MSDLTVDEFGLIVHADGDGGDTMADTFRYLYALKLNGRPNEEMLEKAITHLFPLKGIGRRHHTQWNDPCDLSRDQQTPAVICLLAYGRTDIVHDIYVRHLARNWRYQNLDWANWEHINYYRPAIRDWRGDFLMFLGSLARISFSWISDKWLYMDINHQLALIQAALHGHSFWSRCAAKTYRWFRFGGPMYPWLKFHQKDNPAIAREFSSPVTFI